MIIVMNAAGQLCNRLVLLAHAYATGLESGQRVVHLVAHDLQKDIRLEGPSLHVTGYDARGLYLNGYEKVMAKLYGPGFRTRHRDRAEEQRARLRKKGLHLLDNWYYRDYEALFTHRRQITEAFSPVEEHARRVAAFADGMRERYPGHAFVGVHIRRGDYKAWRGGAYYYDNDQFCRWMRELQDSTDRRLAFVLFSNEPVSAEDFADSGCTVLCGPGQPIEDLYVMARCDYIFGPPSSYSWWAAFFGERKYLTMYSPTQSIAEPDFAPVAGEEFNPDSAETRMKKG